MSEPRTDPLYAQVGELLTECGTTVGQLGSMMHAAAPEPTASLRALEDRLTEAGLRPRESPTCTGDQARLTVLDTIDRAVSISITVDPLRRAASKG